jgi:hypothetical protein
MIAGASAGDVEQMALAVVDLFEVSIVGDILDALLQWDDLVVARDHRDRAKLQPLRQMHGSDRELARRDLDLVADFDRRNTGLFDGVPRPAKLAGRADEDADLVRLHSLFDPAGDPCANRLRLLFRVIEGFDCRGWPVEHRNGAAPVLCVPVHVGRGWRQQAIGLNSDRARFGS